MLKLSTSYSKKVPVPDKEFSSQSFHACVELELSDALAPEQIQARIHETFTLVKTAVESELTGKVGVTPPTQPVRGHALSEKASNRQIKFITDLASRQSFELSALNARVRQQFGVASLYDLDRKQASQLLDELNRKKAA